MNQYNQEGNFVGKYAWLKKPYNGYTRILILERSQHKWIVEICGSGLELEFYEDEFEVDE